MDPIEVFSLKSSTKFSAAGKKEEFQRESIELRILLSFSFQPNSPNNKTEIRSCTR